MTRIWGHFVILVVCGLVIFKPQFMLNIKRTVFTLYMFYFKCTTKSANIFLSAICVAIRAQIILDAEPQWHYFFAQFSKSGVGIFKAKVGNLWLMLLSEYYQQH